MEMGRLRRMYGGEMQDLTKRLLLFHRVKLGSLALGISSMRGGPVEVQGQGEGGFLALLPKLQSLKTKGVYPTHSLSVKNRNHKLLSSLRYLSFAILCQEIK